MKQLIEFSPNITLANVGQNLFVNFDTKKYLNCLRKKSCYYII